MLPVQVPDFRVTTVEPITPPALLREEVSLPRSALDTVLQARRGIARVLRGEDDRMIVVAGPCSVHDPDAALAYGEQLSVLAGKVSDSLLVIMRVYLEKPRTRLGWKGLINDPHLDGSQDINNGLRLARELMVKILDVGVPIGCEFLDPVIAQYIYDAVSWGSIGARTVQSQVHRQLASGLSMPIGIKNSTSGEVQDAIDAVITASRPHVFPSVDDDGVAVVTATSGNPDCHVVLRGSNSAPNYGAAHVARALDLLQFAGLSPSLFIDASHGNSGKDHKRQPLVVADVARRIALGERGIAGVMLESFLVAGRQELILGQPERLVYGQSVTDSCVDWCQTVSMVEQLAEAVDARRFLRSMSIAG
jgi:3-deoxy-7-phosphoheptulonate synthase